MELTMIIRRGGILCDKNENFIMDVSCVNFYYVVCHPEMFRDRLWNPSAGRQVRHKICIAVPIAIRIICPENFMSHFIRKQWVIFNE